MKIPAFATVAFAGLTLAACNDVTVTAKLDPEVQEVVDKAAIEELLVSYYSHFGGSENEDFGAYYTEDAIFDVNGIVSTGREEIVALYNNADEADEGEDAAAEPAGQFRMMATNIEIDIDGDTATARLLWTGVMNSDPFAPPTVVEQGREYDKFVRAEDGSWLISHRVVVADSGIPDFYATNYEPRPDFSFDDTE